ncbi:MAG: GGDEF domain-containing protein [Christensenellales bacterium]
MRTRWQGGAISAVGMAAFLIAVFVMLLINFLSPDEMGLIYLAMTGLSFVCAIFGFMGYPYLMAILAASLSGAWTVYKLYTKFFEGALLVFPYDYLWIIVPFFPVVGITIFIAGNSRLKYENELLRKQAEEAVFVDELTGLLNLRAMYHEFPKMVSYSKRYKQPLTLALITLRHEQELRAFLSESKFHLLVQMLAGHVSSNARMEDRLYCIDNKGSLALLAISDPNGMDVIIKRLRAAISQPDAFTGITKNALKVSTRIAYLEYPNDSAPSPFDFKQAVEACLAYDV